MQGLHARLPGSSLMCCHKTCSWQRLNVQWDCVLLQHTEPWVLPFQLSHVHVSFCSVCAPSESHRPDISDFSQHNISIHCSPSGKCETVRRLLGLQSTKMSSTVISKYWDSGGILVLLAVHSLKFILQMKIRPQAVI